MVSWIYGVQLKILLKLISPAYFYFFNVTGNFWIIGVAAPEGPYPGQFINVSFCFDFLDLLDWRPTDHRPSLAQLCLPPARPTVCDLEQEGFPLLLNDAQRFFSPVIYAQDRIQLIPTFFSLMKGKQQGDSWTLE